METIFTMAVALEQSGKMKNTIYLINSNIYIMNSDQTILLRFPLRSHESKFSQDISFKASDYDSKDFYEQDGKIIFITKKDNYQKKKICGTSTQPKEIQNLYNSYLDNFKKEFQFDLSGKIIQLLETDLSHIEFTSENKEIKLIQRNIYDGTISEITNTKRENSFDLSHSDIPSNFGPVGMRTNDFVSLFSFHSLLTFSFYNNLFCYIDSNDPKFPMSGFISLCQYDEMGNIETAIKKEEPHARRKKQESRNSEPETHREVTKSTSSGRRKRNC